LKTAEGTPGCTLAAGSPGFPLATGPDKYVTPVPMCLLHTGTVGEWTEATVTYHGQSIRAAIRLLNRPCNIGSTRPGRCGTRLSEWYYLRVPKATGGDSGGLVLLRLDYQPPRAAGGYSFYTSRDTFGVTADGGVSLTGEDNADVRSAQPQLDTFATSVRPEGGTEGQSLLIVNWVADRPVIVTAQVEGNDPETCSRDPRPSVASPTLANSGTLRLAGLCAGTQTSVGLTLHTEAGASATYSDLEGVHADRVGPGYSATTDRIPITISPAIMLGPDLSGLFPGSVVRTLGANLYAGTNRDGRWGPDTQMVIRAPIASDLQEPLLAVIPPVLNQMPCASATAFRFTAESYVARMFQGPGARTPLPLRMSLMVPEDLHFQIAGNFEVGNEACGLPNDRLLGFALSSAENLHYYPFTVTTFGPDSILLNPRATHGVDPNPHPAIVVQLNAQS
ncbi:MAG: hypothetical protein M3527_05530, partial [Actinomycetota bacterium]|nr:hypothetical protein [Actinomycetota bacterium]